jgi:2,3,4,5-tetrahydropyridine-2-carboxylate N-succinyltransferase
VGELRERVRAAYRRPELLGDADHLEALEETMARLDGGAVRVATPGEAPGEPWTVHEWVKEAILLYFRVQEIRTVDLGPFEYRDKIPMKRGWEAAGVRVVPPATARYGSFIAAGCVLMPCYVNSCAQIGANVHLSGGVGIGGVLEPPSATPVIVEDGCFLGSRAIVVEGVRIEREVVLGANVTLTASTPIVDVTGPEPLEHRGRVPARSVVVPGTRPKRFASGEHHLACALIIGKRQESTDRRTSLNRALRDFDVPV